MIIELIKKLINYINYAEGGPPNFPPVTECDPLPPEWLVTSFHHLPLIISLPYIISLPLSLLRVGSTVSSSSTSAARYWPVERCLKRYKEFQ